MCGVCGVWLRVINPILLEVLGGVESYQPHTVGGFRVKVCWHLGLRSKVDTPYFTIHSSKLIKEFRGVLGLC